MPQLSPSDLLTWGRLLKSWATGLNYLDNITSPPTAADTLPASLGWQPSMTVAAFQAIIAEVAADHLPAGLAGFTVDVPASLTTVLVTQHDDTNVYINLPSADEVAEGDNALLAGGNYTVSAFDLALYGIAPATPPTNPPKTPVDEMALTANYIGSYTSGNCRRG